MKEAEHALFERMAGRPAARKASERQRKRASGLVPVEVWCKPADRERIRKYIARLNR